MTTSSRLFRCSLLQVLALFVLSAAFIAPPVAHADAIKLGGFWIEGVQIRGIQNGNLIYVTGGSQVEQPLAKVQRIKLRDHPEFEQALEAVESGKDAKAIRLLRVVRKASRDVWLKQYVDSILVGALDRLGKGEPAIDSYKALVRSKADPFFLADPPILSATRLSDDVKTRLSAELVLLAGLVRDASARESFDTLLNALKVQADQPDPLGRDGSSAGPPAPFGDTGLVVIPMRVPADNTSAQLLAANKLDEAMAEADKALRLPGTMGEKLFLKALVQLAVAEKAVDADPTTRLRLYKDAGLTFMKIVIYKPQSPYGALALLEAGYVHEKIGRHDIAQALYAEAGSVIENEQEEYPHYYQRLLTLTGTGPLE